MRPKSNFQKPSNSTSFQLTFRYSIQAHIQQIQLNIRFPCKLSIHWNYGQGSVTSVKPIALQKSIARFNEVLSFITHINFNEEKQQYVEQKTTIEIFIITENGNSLAGFVTLDLGKLISGVGMDKKEMYQIERCPDRGANLKMKLSCQFLTEKYPRVTNIESSTSYKNKEKEKEKQRNSSAINQLSQIKGDYSRRIDPQSVKNKQLIERQLTSLKNKLSQYQSKYKAQKVEKQKLNDLLKGKQQVYFTLKTQIKRKQIEIDGMMKSLDQYRFQYQRLKTDNDILLKTKQKLQSMLDSIEKSSHQKISRLESENVSLMRRFQKLESQFGRMNREKDTLFISIKQKNQGSSKEKEMFNQSTRMFKKEKDEILRNYRMDKQSYQKLHRQSNRKIEQLEEQLNDIKEKYSGSNKKVTKIEQQRIQQITKNNLKIIQLQKLKQSLNMQLTAIKRQINKKDHHHTETHKMLQKQLNEERMNNGKLTQSVIDLQNEKKLQGVELQRQRQNYIISQQNKKKLQQQIQHLKYQTNNLNQLLSSKTNELKTLSLQSKQFQQLSKRTQHQLQQRHKQATFQFQVQLRQLRRTQENKYLNVTTNNIRKQKDLEDTLIREQKLSMHIETMKEEYKKNEQMWKQKIEILRNNQQHLKQECLSLTKKKDEQGEELIERMREMELEIHSLNEGLSQAKESQFKILERQDRLRVEKEEIFRIYNQLKISSLQLREQLEEYREEIEGYESNKVELNRELQLNQSKYSKLVRELKERILQVQEQKIKLVSNLKEKERNWSQSNKLLKQQIEEYKNEISRKQHQVRKSDDQYRNLSQKEKSKLNELEIDIEKLQNEIIKSNNLASQKETLIEQLHSQIRDYRDNIKSMVMEKDSLLKSKEQVESEQSELKQSINNYDNQLHQKNKQIKEMKYKIEELEGEIKDNFMSKKRNKTLFDDIYMILNRLSDTEVIVQLFDLEINQYQSLMEIRKKLLVIQNRLNKQRQISSISNDQSRRQVQDTNLKLQQYQSQISKLKAQLNNLKRVEETQAEQINTITLENQQLIYQINTLQTNLIVFKTNSTVLDNKLKDQHEYYKSFELQTKRQLEKYQKLLNDTTSQLSEKYQKQKRELLNTIRSAEEKIETLEQKNFSLELDNQKIQQFSKREEENKKVFARLYELERENFQLLQLQKDYQEKNTSIQEKLGWEKNLLQQSNKTLQSKIQTTLTQLQTQSSRLTIKNKQLTSLLKQKQFLLEQTDKNIIVLQQQSQQQISTLKLQNQKVIDSQFKLKNEFNKLKSQLQLYKTNNQQNKDKLISMESLARIKGELETELQQKNSKIIELEDKEQKQNQQIFKITQQFQQFKWDYQRALTGKQNQLMNLQQELYTINSKENIRMLRQIQYSQRQKQMELQKKGLMKEINQYKDKYRQLIENQRIEVVSVRNYEEQKMIEENQKKHQEIVRILEEEIKNLKNQSNGYK